ncbi:hypothetical protein ZOSMA_6690G00010, partial [Zostera marina]
WRYFWTALVVRNWVDGGHGDASELLWRVGGIAEKHDQFKRKNNIND